MIRLIGVKIELGSTLRRPATIAALLRLLKMMHLAVRIREIKGVALKSGNLTVHPARGLANCAIQFNSDMVASSFEFPR